MLSSTQYFLHADTVLSPGGILENVIFCLSLLFVIRPDRLCDTHLCYSLQQLHDVHAVNIPTHR